MSFGWFPIYTGKAHPPTKFECNLAKIMESSRWHCWSIDSVNNVVKFLYSILSHLRDIEESSWMQYSEFFIS